MIIQQRLTSRSSRSLAVMIGFAQPAGSRGTWRSDGDIDSGTSFRAHPSLFCSSFPQFPKRFAATSTGHSTRCALGRPDPRCEAALQSTGEPTWIDVPF